MLQLAANTHSIAVKLELGGRRGEHTSTLMHARHIHRDTHTNTHTKAHAETQTNADTHTDAQIRPELGVVMYCC